MKVTYYSTVLVVLQTCFVLNASDVTDKKIEQATADKNKDYNISVTEGKQNKVNLNLDKETAIKLAEVILVRIYGEGVLKQRPWIVTDNGMDFKIEGTFHSEGWSMKGGVAEIIISKSDARVIKYTHGK